MINNVSKFKYLSNQFFSLVVRHLKVLLSNAIRLFYTLMVPVVLLVVYFLFLRELEVSTVESELLKLGINTQVDGFVPLIKTVIDSWMLSGVIALSSITISLQICSLIVEDKTAKVSRDFISSPVNKYVLISSYFIYLFIVTYVLCVVVLLISFLFLGILGEFVLTFGDFLLLLLIILFTTTVSCLTALIVSALVKSEPVLASISAIVSTAAGFLIGAYMPLSILPIGIQNFCAFVPWTYSCALIRYAFLSRPLDNLSIFINDPKKIVLPNNINSSEISLTLENSFSYKIYFFGNYINPWVSTLVTGLIIIIFIIISIFVTNKLLDVESKRKINRKK